MATKVSAGKDFKRNIRRMRAARSVKAVRVGFFRTAKYDDGTSVAAVAAWQEFGTDGGKYGGPIPERPFFRNALSSAKPQVLPLLKRTVNIKEPAVTAQIAVMIGELVQGEIQQSITTLRSPELSEVTIERRRRRLRKPVHSDNPLVDTGVLRGSVTYAVET